MSSVASTPAIGYSNSAAVLNKVKNFWLTPTSFMEFVAFAVIVILLYMVFSFFHNNSIQAAVRKKSRCLRAKEIGRIGGQYIVKATNRSNNALYDVGYDLTTKEFDVKCACPEGKVSNTFYNIPVYNMNTKTATSISEKTCGCDQNYFTRGDPVYYSGYPSLVNFMNSGDLSFFQSALNPTFPA